MAARKAHQWLNFILRGFTVCGGCGLIALRNRATERAANKPCPGQDED